MDCCLNAGTGNPYACWKKERGFPLFWSITPKIPTLLPFFRYPDQWPFPLMGILLFWQRFFAQFWNIPEPSSSFWVTPTSCLPANVAPSRDSLAAWRQCPSPFCGKKSPSRFGLPMAAAPANFRSQIFRHVLLTVFVPNSMQRLCTAPGNCPLIQGFSRHILTVFRYSSSSLTAPPRRTGHLHIILN